MDRQLSAVGWTGAWYAVTPVLRDAAKHCGEENVCSFIYEASWRRASGQIVRSFYPGVGGVYSRFALRTAKFAGLKE